MSEAVTNRRLGPAVLEAAGAVAVLLACLAAVFWDMRCKADTHLADVIDGRMFLTVLQWDVEALAHARSWGDVWQLPCQYPEPNHLATSEHMLGGAVLYAPLYRLTGNSVLALNAWLL